MSEKGFLLLFLFYSHKVIEKASSLEQPKISFFFQFFSLHIKMRRVKSVISMTLRKT